VHFNEPAPQRRIFQFLFTQPARGRWLFRAASAVCAIASLFHVAALVWPFAVSSTANDSPTRHGVFIAINGALAVLLFRAPRTAALALLPLTAQQLWSHGTDLAAARAAQQAQWDTRSLIVLIGLPLLWFGIAWSLWPRPHAREL
jgi:hypothetical protein